jgi:hypothetical protein
MSEPHTPRRRFARGSLVLVSALLAAFAVDASAEEPGTTPASLDPPAPEPPPLRLVVNIPAFRLDVYEGGTLTQTFPVTVGKPSDPTPDGHYQLERVVWNPWWHPPWNRRPRDKDTPPGPNNPMGKVKLYFANLYYLHGTPKLREIGTPASRGCVRLRNQDAVTLALLVHRHAMAPLAPGKLEELASTRNWGTHGYTVDEPVPVDLVYDVAEVRDGELRLYPDFYHMAPFPLGELAARALERAGYTRDRIRFDALATAVAAVTSSLRLPVDELLVPIGADSRPATVEVAAQPR